MSQLDPKLVEDFLDTMNRLRAAMMRHHASASTLRDKIRGMRKQVATGLQLRALSIIDENPGLTAGELAEKFMMSRPAVAQLLFRMFRTKWVDHTHDPDDRRVVHLSLTALGREELQKMKKEFFSAIEPVLSLIPEADLVELVRIQKNLITKIEAESKS